MERGQRRLKKLKRNLDNADTNTQATAIPFVWEASSQRRVCQAGPHDTLFMKLSLRLLALSLCACGGGRVVGDWVRQGGEVER